MKYPILTLTVLTALLSLSPAIQARDKDRPVEYEIEYRDKDAEIRADYQKLWDWSGHLKDEAKARDAGHKIKDRLDILRDNLRHVASELNDGHVKRDHMRAELADIRDGLSHVSEDLHPHAEATHRPGITIQVR